MFKNFFCCGPSNTNVEPQKETKKFSGAENWCIVFDQRLEFFFDEAAIEIPEYIQDALNNTRQKVIQN